MINDWCKNPWKKSQIKVVNTWHDMTYDSLSFGDKDLEEHHYSVRRDQCLLLSTVKSAPIESLTHWHWHLTYWSIDWTGEPHEVVDLDSPEWSAPVLLKDFLLWICLCIFMAETWLVNTDDKMVTGDWFGSKKFKFNLIELITRLRLRRLVYCTDTILYWTEPWTELSLSVATYQLIWSLIWKVLTVLTLDISWLSWLKFFGLHTRQPAKASES